MRGERRRDPLNAPGGHREHGAGIIAKRSRVEGLPVRAEQGEPSTRLLQSISPGSVYLAPGLRYNWRDKSRLTFARIIMRAKLALQLAAVGHFIFRS